jgi:hypothetical protein
MPKQFNIDGNKYDIRVTCINPTDSDDAGFVEGVPIDPPDSEPGWLLCGFELETDMVQEKGEKGQLVTKKTDPRYHCLWVRPKAKQRKPRKQRKSREQPAEPPPSEEPKAEAQPPAPVAPAPRPPPRPPLKRKAKAKSKKAKRVAKSNGNGVAPKENLKAAAETAHIIEETSAAANVGLEQ